MLKMLKIKWLRSEKEIKYKIIRSQSYLLISFEETPVKISSMECILKSKEVSLNSFVRTLFQMKIWTVRNVKLKMSINPNPNRP